MSRCSGRVNLLFLNTLLPNQLTLTPPFGSYESDNTHDQASCRVRQNEAPTCKATKITMSEITIPEGETLISLLTVKLHRTQQRRKANAPLSRAALKM
jgi:hypothetical protein